MITVQRPPGLRFALLASLAILAAHASNAQAPTYATIYSFKGPEGGAPHASVIIGPQGGLFGTASGGGVSNYGTVFELSNPTGNAWIEKTLYSFSAEPDGQYPQANVVFGPGGALYGTTQGGGMGGGTIFELAAPAAAGAAWTESVLYEFNLGVAVQVDAPFGAVLFTEDGTLLSTARGASGNVAGGVVALAPPAAPGGPWKESTLLIFGTPVQAGKFPEAGLVTESGSFYGTNYYSGNFACASGCGSVYELTPPAILGDGWTITGVYDFLGVPNDGEYPQAPLTVGAAGVLYGTTTYGGTGACSTLSGCGTVFQLTPPPEPGLPWTETVIYSFTGTNGDGAYPIGSVLLGENGVLYGTTQHGGNVAFDSVCPATYYTLAGCGIVFELMPPLAPGGAWTETVLHSFTGQDGDGALPEAGLVLSTKGVLYGTTSAGGSVGDGTVFAIKP